MTRAERASQTGYLSTAQAPLHWGRPRLSQDLSASHSLQKAPDAVQPGGHCLQEPVMELVTHMNWMRADPDDAGHRKAQEGRSTAGKSQKDAPHAPVVVEVHTVVARADARAQSASSASISRGFRRPRSNK